MRKNTQIWIILGNECHIIVNPNIQREESAQLSCASNWPGERLLSMQWPAELCRFLPLNVGIYTHEESRQISGEGSENTFRPF